MLFNLARFTFSIVLLIISIRRSQTSDGESKILEIANDIKSHKFADANFKIVNSSIVLPNVKIIVEKLLIDHSDNFEPITEYAENSHEVLISFSLLISLWEIKKTSELGLEQLIKLKTTIDKAVINKNGVPLIFKSWTENLLQLEILPKIITKVAEKLSAAILGDDYDNFQFAVSSLNILNNEACDEIMRRTIDISLGKIPNDALIRRLYNFSESSNNNERTLKILNYIYEKIRNRDDSRAILVIAHFLDNLKNLTEAQKLNVKNLIRNFPESVVNLYFKKKVCLRNARHGEYVFSPAEGAFYNPDRRFLYTAEQSTIWYANRFADFMFEFESEFFKNEFMYAADMKVTDLMSRLKSLFGNSESYRYVFTWIPGQHQSLKFLWQVELCGEKIKIINMEFDEYLCAASVFEGDYRILHTSPETMAGGDDCHWTVTDCSQR